MLVTLDDIINKKTIHRSNNINNNFSDLFNKINQIAEKIKFEQNHYEKIDKAKSQFIANATHEFKTPIFSIKGYIETLKDGAINDSNVNNIFLNKIYNQSKRLEKLFNNLINISKIELNELDIKFEKVLLNEIMIVLSETFSESANNKGLNLFIPNTKDMIVLGNKELLQTCFINLVDNAIKYSKKGTISISKKN